MKSCKGWVDRAALDSQHHCIHHIKKRGIYAENEDAYPIETCTVWSVALEIEGAVGLL